VRKAAPGVLEHPENPKAWNLVPREKLVESGIPVLPGPQKLKPEQAENLKAYLSVIDSFRRSFDILRRRHSICFR